MTVEVRILEALPEGLLECDATELEASLGGPSMVHIPGRQEPPLFVSVLLHGNETSGWNGVRKLLAKHPVPALSLILFIGNVAAAAAGVRKLPHQQDFNRIWREASGDEAALSASVMDALGGYSLHAVVDLHNNTGMNPHYSLLSELDPECLGLAGLFSDKAVYVVEPSTTLARAFRGRCPAVTLELGPVGDPGCEEHALSYLEKLLALPGLPAPDTAPLALYRSLGRVYVPDEVDFSFGGAPGDSSLVFACTEAVNFRELPVGSLFAVSAEGIAPRVDSPDHADVTWHYLHREGNHIVTRRPLVPAMYTMDPAAVRHDCLCYFMERITPGAAPAGA